MTLDEYIKEMDLPEMELMGKMKNFKYYIEIVPTEEMNDEVGEPIVIEENLITHTFKVCHSDQKFALMKYFAHKEK